jgi:hypothetical protein
MMVDIAMRDGRTTFRFTKRSVAVELMKRDPLKLDEERPLGGWVRWQPDASFVPIRANHLGKNAISFVTQVPNDEAAAFLAAQQEPERREAERPGLSLTA